MTDVLCELRGCGRGATPQAENLARKIQSRVGEVCASVGQAVSRYVFVRTLQRLNDGLIAIFQRLNDGLIAIFKG